MLNLSRRNVKLCGELFRKTGTITFVDNEVPFNEGFFTTTLGALPYLCEKRVGQVPTIDFVSREAERSIMNLSDVAIIDREHNTPEIRLFLLSMFNIDTLFIFDPASEVDEETNTVSIDRLILLE